MKKYEFVNVSLKNNPATNAVLAEHREIINKYAEKGYEYVGFVPTKQGASGKMVEIDLIFAIQA